MNTNSLNRDQQNKTERWEEKLDKIIDDTDVWGGDEIILRKRVKELISQLLSDARREERNRCLEAIGGEWIDNPNGEVNLYTCGRRDERKKAVKAIKSLTTAEESIKELDQISQSIKEKIV